MNSHPETLTLEVQAAPQAGQQGRCAVTPDSPPAFEAWMNRTHKGFYYGAWPCWSWRVGGVLVTLWLANRIVKIYHDEGRAAEWHPADTEMARDAIATLLANIVHETTRRTDRS